MARTEYHDIILDLIPRYKSFAKKYFPEDVRGRTYLNQLELEALEDAPLPRLCRRWGVVFGFLITHPEFPHASERRYLATLFDPLDDLYDNEVCHVG